VIVCSHNGAGRIRECLAGIDALDYPNLDVIVIDDGSHDETSEVAREFPVRVIRTDHRGLSHARNAGLEAARGEIVAYLDDDSYPDPGWLKYLVATLIGSSHAGVGGPNIAPPGDGLVADCVAHAPGGPTHVLLSDTEAEHIPGCNMAFRAGALRAIGGFDAQFRVAGDDVDICWRLQQRGGTLGFSPAAVVWHHCRDSVRGYWKQQRQYGRAEALLERKWPQKYTRSGHLMWAGRLYGSGLASTLVRPARVYHGMWGSAPFQFRSRDEGHPVRMLPAVPEWYLLLAVTLALTALGADWRPLLIAAPILTAGIIVSGVQAFIGSRPAGYAHGPGARVARPGRAVRRGLTTCLHLMQPLARLVGRLGAGLTPWRGRPMRGLAVPRRRTMKFWLACRQEPERWLQSLEAALVAQAARVSRGGEYDRWDLEARSGLFGTVRILTAVEDHGAGRQLVRVRLWPRWTRAALMLMALGGLLAFAASVDHAWIAATILGSVAGLLVLRLVYEGAVVTAAVLRAVDASLGERR
jgi:GT2 family glycosyltransferase